MTHSDVRLFPLLFIPMVIHGNRIIEIEWAFKNNKDYVPSPKPSRKSKHKKRAKSYFGQETAMAGRSEAAEFGMELTNTESPTKSKRSFADTETVDSTQTPPKRQRRMNIVTPVVKCEL